MLERRNPGLQLQLIITTHSPFMLSDTISSQVTRIDYDEDGECIVLNPSDKEYFGNPRSVAKGKELHTKMKEDLIGW